MNVCRGLSLVAVVAVTVAVSRIRIVGGHLPGLLYLPWPRLDHLERGLSGHYLVLRDVAVAERLRF
ncbi:MAG TPA: hypothetical protein VF070_07545 [Streptosporangiaceae bacterium]